MIIFGVQSHERSSSIPAARPQRCVVETGLSSRLFGLAPTGVPCRALPDAVLYPPFTLQHERPSLRRSVFWALSVTHESLARARHYRAACPAEPGLSRRADANFRPHVSSRTRPTISRPNISADVGGAGRLCWLRRLASVAHDDGVMTSRPSIGPLTELNGHSLASVEARMSPDRTSSIRARRNASTTPSFCRYTGVTRERC